MEVMILKDDKDFIMLENAWRGLEEKDSEIPIYSTYDFNKCWWDAYSKDNNNSLFIIYVMKNEEVLGIAPLYLKRRKKGFLEWKELHFIGQGDYFNFIIDRTQNNSQTIIKYLFDAIYENLDKWDRLVLSYISSESELAHYLLKDDRYNKKTKYLVEIPYLDFKEIKSIDDISLPSKVRKYRNKLDREIGYEFRVLSSIDDEMYERITNLHKKQQEYLREEADRKDRRSLFDNKLNDEYVNSLKRVSDKTLLFVLTDRKGEIICYKNTYLHNGSIYSWNTAYNTDFIEYSTNGTIYLEIFNYIIKNMDIEKFDFGAGRYPWKFRWTNDFVLSYRYEDWNLSSSRMMLINKLFSLKS